ncbi:hypothetical protein CLCAR_4151 [Clostridium carboxidivorans P7]|nr:hypothetical protein CLCAR_4151 [Clostridium carboxidivorans P7]
MKDASIFCVIEFILPITIVLFFSKNISQNILTHLLVVFNAPYSTEIAFTGH